MKVPLIGILFRSIKAYYELLSQGVVMSSVSDENVEVILKGFITGDIQVHIHHRKGTLLSATNLQEVGGEAVVLFKRKFTSLKFLPGFLITLINLGILYIYFQPFIQQFESFRAIDLQEILKPQNLTSLIIPALSVAFARTIGSLIIKFFFQLAIWFRRFYSFITRRRKIHT